MIGSKQEGTSLTIKILVDGPPAHEGEPGIEGGRLWEKRQSKINIRLEAELLNIGLPVARVLSMRFT